MSKVIIRKITEEQTDPKKDKKNKKPIFRMRKYKDTNTGLVFDFYDTYRENKALYLETFRKVCNKTYKDMFEAYEHIMD